ncbi:MAG TPA: polysaccharide pyruvyl transferase family protein [Candidatus Eisenbacteria bacterium]|nr:polysaccharide pyruvyl transferase family protein [Candidatus Eisenbacteria bacterium]
MRFGAFSYAYSTNVGDEIQTLAATQFLPRVDALIERDRLHWYRNCSPIFVIFNGWFTRQPCWPPPDSILPLFVAFHAAKPELLVNKRDVDYFKRHEPIGCRSLATLEAFRRIGVDAYFSACLTLTLKPEPVERSDQIYAVDVDPALYERLIPDGVKKMTARLSHEFPPPGAGLPTRAKWNSARTLLRGLYKWDVTRPILAGAGERLNRSRHLFRLSKAREILSRYSSAKLVITSRLHCALPCLALGTPVLLLRPGVESDPRFAGLRELVRFHSDPSSPIKIDWRNPDPNPDTYLGYAKALRERCENAVARMSRPDCATATPAECVQNPPSNSNSSHNRKEMSCV